MDLALDPAQEDVRRLARQVLGDHAPGPARAAEPLGYDPAMWRRAAAAGLCGMGLPEDVGGGGAGLDLLVVAAEEAGRALAPVPFVEHAVAGRLLARVAPRDPRLAPLASGDTIAALALRPAESGLARLVPAGAVAGIVVGLDDGRLVRVEGEPPMSAPANFACAPLADRELRSAAGTVLLEAGPSATAAFDEAHAEWRTLTAAALVGIAGAALDLAVAYVKERRQFGVAIGSFQAVQHGLADLPGAIDGARLLAHEAAWAQSTGEPSATGASGDALSVMAFLFAAETAKDVTARCVQYHGGYGYAEEQDPQLYYRRARGWALAGGRLDAQLAVLADLTLGPLAAGVA